MTIKNLPKVFFFPLLGFQNTNLETHAFKNDSKHPLSFKCANKL